MAKGAQAEGVVTLGEALAGFVGHQWTVAKGGRRQSKRAVEQKLAGGGEEEVGPANDFGDLHGGIVHDNGKLVSRNVVVTPDDEITEVFSGDESLRAEMTVGELNRLAIGNPETPINCGVRDAECGINGGPTGARINQFFIRDMRSAYGGLDVLARAGAGIDGAGSEQTVKRGAIERDARALKVGSEPTAAVRAFLPLEAEPAKVFEHGGSEFRPATIGVEVFVAENELAGVFARALLRDPKRAGMAEMQKTGGRRREAAAILR
jgi:hypothetical protein